MNVTELSRLSEKDLLVVSVGDLKQAFALWLGEVQNPQEETDKLLTITEVAALLRCDRSSIWRWCKDGLLAKVKIGGKLRFQESEVRRFIKESRA